MNKIDKIYLKALVERRKLRSEKRYTLKGKGVDGCFVITDEYGPSKVIRLFPNNEVERAIKMLYRLKLKRNTLLMSRRLNSSVRIYRCDVNNDTRRGAWFVDL